MFPILFDLDGVHDRISEEDRAKVFANPKDVSGYERIVSMFTVDEMGRVSKELNYVIKATSFAAVSGAIIGGMIGSKGERAKFMEANQATAFETPLEAKRQLQDRVMTGFARQGWRWGWRLALFTGMFTTASTMMTVYRGRTSVTNFTIPGMLTGALYKSNLGLRGIVVGGTVGLMLGTFCGGLSVFMLQMAGVSMDDIYAVQYKSRERRQALIDAAWENASKEKHTTHSRAHDERIEKLKQKNN